MTVGGVAQAVPIKLHVYDFALPKKIGFDGNWNLSFQALGGSESLAAVEKLKTWLYEHRIVPSSVAWPAGLNYNGGIEYDCASGTFKEEANDYDFSRLGPKYVGGVGWNGEGFPSFEAMHFVDNATPRPQTFCGVDRGPDHFGTPQYNAAWSKLLSAIDAYLVAKDWTGKGYYYVQNEPQGPDDYDVAAHLASLTKAAAPHLRIAISEEPKPEIAENPRANGKSYDLWWADLRTSSRATRRRGRRRARTCGGTSSTETSRRSSIRSRSITLASSHASRSSPRGSTASRALRITPSPAGVRIRTRTRGPRGQA